MQDVFGRKLRPMDFVIAEGKKIRDITLDKSNFNLIVAEDKVFNGESVRKADLVYLIEKPCLSEEQIRRELALKWNTFIKKETERKREQSREASNIKKDIKNWCQVGDILASTFSYRQVIYLGKCRIIDNINNVVKEGYCYCECFSSYHDIDTIIKLYENKVIDLESFIDEIIDKNILYHGYSKNEMQKYGGLAYKAHIDDIKDLTVTKGLSKKYAVKLGHINIRIAPGYKMTIYTRIRNSSKHIIGHGTVLLEYLGE